MHAALNSYGLCRAITKAFSSSMPAGQRRSTGEHNANRQANKKWALTSANQKSEVCLGSQS